MLRFDVKDNEIHFGTSHADMINRVLGTHFLSYQRASVELTNWGAAGVIAWFVFMDGTEHGFADSMLWKNNYLIDKITEELTNRQEATSLLYTRRAQESYYPYRLAFQLDPLGKNNRYSCRFVGVFALTGFYEKDLTKMRYTKVADSFCLANQDMGQSVNTKDDIIPKIGNYRTPLTNLGFSSKLDSLFKNAHMNYSGELLELEGLTNAEYQREIREKLWECYKIE